MGHATELDLKQLIAMQKQVAELAVRRRHIRSQMGGSHLSRLRGRGMEFDEVRVYQPGDEVSAIDWKVTARKGVTHTKIFREERERPVLMCLDYRSNMFFATRGALKSVVATQTAALLAWHGVEHGDRLGGLLFTGEDHYEIKPMRGRKGVLQFLQHCCQSESWTAGHHVRSQVPTSFEETTLRLRQLSKPGSLIYLLSDFRGLNAVSAAHLAQLGQHNDVVLIVVYDDIELSFSQKGAYPVYDGSAYFTCIVDKKFQKRLGEQYIERLEILQALQKKHGIHYITIATDDNVAEKVREDLWAL